MKGIYNEKEENIAVILCPSCRVESKARMVSKWVEDKDKDAMSRKGKCLSCGCDFEVSITENK